MREGSTRLLRRQVPLPWGRRPLPPSCGRASSPHVVLLGPSRSPFPPLLPLRAVPLAPGRVCINV